MVAKKKLTKNAKRSTKAKRIVAKPKNMAKKTTIKNKKNSVKATNKKLLIGGAIAIGVLLVALVVVSFLSKFFAGDPNIEIEGATDVVVTREDGKMPIEISGGIEMDCIMQNQIGSDLKPTSGGKNESLVNGVDPTYLKYSNLVCSAEINGRYSAGGKYDAMISVNPAEGFKLSENSLNSFVLKKEYDIYANGVGMPDGESNAITIKLSGKDSDKSSATRNTLVEYNLTVKVNINDTDRLIVSDWKKKIDDKEAEEKRKAEEEARKAEEARQKAEAEAAAQRQNAIDNAITPSYTDLFRNSSNYRGKYIKVTGRILQTDSSNSYCRVATKKSYGTYFDDVVYVSPCSTSTKLLEDDIVSIIGRGNGTKTYTTVLGASVELPMIKGEYFSLYNKFFKL